MTDSEQIILEYKNFYKKITPHQSRRQEVLVRLSELLRRYAPFIEDLENDRYFYETEFSTLVSETDKFMEETFRNEVVTLFKTSPEKPTVPRKRHINLTTQLVNDYFEILKESKRTHSTDKVNMHLFRNRMLKKIYECLKDYGLHPEIYNRDKSVNSRFNIIIEHKQNRKATKKEILQLISFKKLNEEYIQQYKKGKTLLINGTRLESASVQRITITSTILRDDEIHNYKEKTAAKTNLDFVLACYDETNNLLQNPNIDSAIELNADIWSLIHPKLQQLIKPLFFNSQFTEAVRTAFIELNDIIKSEYRKISGEELDGDKLMRKVFSPNNPIFFLGDISTESGQNVQQGYMELFAGSIKGIRNPKAHKNMRIDPIEALEKIIISSHLLKVFETRIKTE